MHFYIGVLFRSVGASESLNQSSTKNNDWTITIKSENDLRTIELLTNGKAILIRDLPSDPVDFDLVASYTGETSDFDEILMHHPMRHSQYSPCFNNCQHFAAIFFILLHSFAHAHPNRDFKPLQRYTTLTTSVIAGDGSNLWNNPNWVMQMAHALTVQTASVLGGVAAAAAKARVVVPEKGIFGWFGVTTAAPAWYAAAAATVAPILVGTTALLTGEYFRRSYVWKMSSIFPDPRVYGFPTASREPLSPCERATDDGTQFMAI